MNEIIKHINDTNASYRDVNAGDAKNTDLFLDNEHYELFKGCGDQITVRFSKENLSKAILFIASILPRKYDNSSVHMRVPFSSSFVLEQLALLDAIFKVDGKPVETRTQTWNVRKDVPKKNGTIDNRFYFNGLIEDIEYLYQGKWKEGKFTIRNYVAGSFSDLHIIKNDDNIFDVRVTNVLQPYDDGKEDGIEEIIDIPQCSQSLQQIFYGAPGTGKSYTINQDTKGEDVVRTTFHPDSDYSTFVGAYKPTTKSVKLRDMAGHVVKDEETNKPVEEDRIVYEFVEQAFLKAYIKAWLNYAQTEDGGEPKKEYLVIEEINRGNCAQIFGDLFQLLDRNASGYSDYPIQADKDMQKQLQKAFKGVSIPQAERINDMYDGKDVVGQVLNGDILLLPNNLYIWATMNTSDQSLFPIDSAFKRRWDWTYVPISDAKKGYTIKVENSQYDWWQFLEKINHKIGEATNSEDKKLGYFFCKADDNGEISAEKFVGKVIFYLWNDVFKDYEFGDAIFNDEDGTKLTFDKFHKAEGRKSEIVDSKVQLFLKNLGLEPSASVDDGLEDSEDSSIPEIKAARREYWDAFLRYAEGNEAFVKCFGEGRTAGASHSTDFSINHPDCHLVVTQSRQKKGLSVSLYFDKTTENYYRLEAKKDEIEQELQIKFEWNEMPDNKASIIRETRNDIAYDDHAQWSVQFDFIIDRMLRMRETFLKYLN